MNKLHTAYLEVVNLLENIGAKCHLAEAYYQYALYIKLNDYLASQTYLEKAINLFQQISALKQIATVSRLYHRL